MNPDDSTKESSGFYMGGDGEYYYDDGRPFPHPFTAKGVIALCSPIKPDEVKEAKP